MSSPLLLLVIPLVGAIITGFMYRWARLTAVCGIIIVGLLWLLLRAEPAAGHNVAVYGRVLALTAGVRGLFLFLYVGVGLLFGLTSAFPQGSKFVPATLAVLAPFMVALMVRPMTLGAVFLAAGLVLLALAVQDDRAGTVQAGLRMVMTAVLCLPFFLLAGWLAETQSGMMAETIGRLVMLAGLILWAAFPFHVWATTIVREAPPLVWLLVLGLAQLVVTTFIFGLLLAQPAFVPAAQQVQMVHWAGGLTLLVAILLMVTAVTLNRLIGGILLVDIACVVLLLAFPAAVGWPTAVTLQISRFISLFLVCVAVLLWQRQGGTLAISKGEGRHLPVTMALLVLGALSLLGLPLTVGFGGRWQVVSLLMGESVVGTAVGTAAIRWPAWLLILALGVGVMALVRVVVVWLARSDNTPVLLADILAAEPRWLQAIAVAMLLIMLWLAWHPQQITGFAAGLAGLFSG